MLHNVVSSWPLDRFFRRGEARARVNGNCRIPGKNVITPRKMISGVKVYYLIEEKMLKVKAM